MDLNNEMKKYITEQRRIILKTNNISKLLKLIEELDYYKYSNNNI